MILIPIISIVAVMAALFHEPKVPTKTTDEIYRERTGDRLK